MSNTNKLAERMATSLADSFRRFGLVPCRRCPAAGLVPWDEGLVEFARAFSSQWAEAIVSAIRGGLRSRGNSPPRGGVT